MEEVPTPAPKPAARDAIVELRDAPEVPPPGTMPGPKGCMLALGLATVFGLGSIALSGVLFNRSHATRLHATEELAAIVERGQSAPGASALREGLCAKAAILPPGDLASIAQTLEDAEAKKKGRVARVIDAGNDPVVYCGVPQAAPDAKCAEVAERFVAAAHPTDPFVVTVRPPETQGCVERFEPNGRSLGVAPAPNVPEL